ncbi:MAG: hypothetical protein DRR42_24825 [Gammaproteobacteria bacterium]|nr:MAG: hypothetical protein DRR42_24825 [Gammaproteobacteria bacterium]
MHDSGTNEESRLDRIEESIGKLHAAQKEREVSFIRALGTLTDDWIAYKKDEREFPREALLGAVFAYLRPRVIIVLASLGAIMLGGFQVWLLLNQNRLLDQQNLLIDAQRRAGSLATINSILGSLKDEDDIVLATSQLSTFGDEGFDVLITLSASRWKHAVAAQTIIAGTAASHSKKQALAVIVSFADTLSMYSRDCGFVFNQPCRKSNPNENAVLEDSILTLLSLFDYYYTQAEKLHGEAPSKDVRGSLMILRDSLNWQGSRQMDLRIQGWGNKVQQWINFACTGDPDNDVAWDLDTLESPKECESFKIFRKSSLR